MATSANDVSAPDNQRSAPPNKFLQAINSKLSNKKGLFRNNSIILTMVFMYVVLFMMWHIMQQIFYSDFL